MIRAGLILGILTLIAGFQNCGNTLKAPGSDSGGHQAPSVDEKVIGHAGATERLLYIQNQVTPPSNGLELELKSGALQVGAKSCVLDATRLEQIRSLLATSAICEPALPPGAVACMAIGIPDIQLISGASTIELRPVVCHNGVYLCGGADQTFRSLLNEIRAQPPAGCAP